MPTSRRCSPPAPDDCGDGSRDLPRAPRPTAPTWPSRSRRRVVPLSEKLLQRRRAADLRDAEPGPGRRGEPQQRQHGRDLLVEGAQPEDRPVPAHRHAGPGHGSRAARAPASDAGRAPRSGRRVHPPRPGLPPARRRPLHSARFFREFTRAVDRTDLPRIRLHDLRHGWATMALSAGVHPKVVQERLGHSSITVTLDVYSHVHRGSTRERREPGRRPDRRGSALAVG